MGHFTLDMSCLLNTETPPSLVQAELNEIQKYTSTETMTTRYKIWHLKSLHIKPTFFFVFLPNITASPFLSLFHIFSWNLFFFVFHPFLSFIPFFYYKHKHTPNNRIFLVLALSFWPYRKQKKLFFHIGWPRTNLPFWYNHCKSKLSKDKMSKMRFGIKLELRWICLLNSGFSFDMTLIISQDSKRL